MGTRDEASTEPGPRAGRKEWTGLAVIALPCLLYSMDLTVLNLALPRLSAELEPTSSELLWIVDIYGFLVAGLLVTMGNLGDRIGRRKLLLVGAVVFGLASVLAAFATSARLLIAARALLGIAGATVAPSTLSLIRNMFLDPRERTTAIGVWISSYSVGGAIGPLLGGMMLHYFWWGSVFLLAVPVMALLLVVGPLLLPEYRDPGARPMDLWSALLSLAAVLTVILGMKLLAEDGPGVVPFASIGVGVVIGLVFTRRQRRLEDPLIDLKLFRSPAFSASLATYLIGTLVGFGSFVFIGQYLQLVMGLSPLRAGLWTLPWAGGFIVGTMAVPALVRRMRPGFVMGAGLALAAAGYGVLILMPSAGLTSLVVGTLLSSLGLAPVVTLATDLIVGAAPPERAGAAAAISETSGELGGALGIAILGSVGTAIYRGAMGRASLPGTSPEAREAASNTLGGAAAAAADLSGPAGDQLLSAARESFTHAMQLTLALCAVITAVAAILAAIALRHMRPGAGHGAAPATGE